MARLPRPHVLIPAAGFGRRFESRDYTPRKGKPFIRFSFDHGPVQTMLDHVAGMFQGEVIVGTRFGMHADEGEISARNVVFETIGETAGQAESVLRLLTCVPYGDPVVVCNCDIMITSPFWYTLTSGTWDAKVMTFQSDEPCYSYLDRDDHFNEIVEKKVVSAAAVAGVYYFRDSQALIEAIRRASVEEKGELYLSAAFKHLPGSKRAGPFGKTYFQDFGTPEKLESNPRVTKLGDQS